jgi:hypothetical protein
MKKCGSKLEPPGCIFLQRPHRITGEYRGFCGRSLNDSCSLGLVSNDLARGQTPRRRTCACHRPLSFRIVAMTSFADRSD